MTTLPLLIRPESAEDAAAVERLHARAFGPGRFARTPYRLREGVPPLPTLSFTALVGTFLVGSVRVGPIRIGTDDALMLGPLTVDPSFENRGIGSALMNRSLDAARQGGHPLMLLVGDAPYYARFGFTRVPHGALTLPGPVDPARVLWRALQPDADITARGEVASVRSRPA
ncbi:MULTISPECIES: N-acetyltransferase [unclassified Methylobacterium]|uniref:GNAT family N-acetyltransferase n=1 Tax=unclassified Methylobacterium TaxID=2615210 RepID=UPI0006F45491|nr:MULTISPECIES: N-acetyltransferase [unclassified Methylobacterium]KQP59159.1 GCN5 family acetyltransferase [Methylobacterium sp. Leaf108]KQT88829.1 GCN5 family acetyltransferase [Methylobacterium sp. Leaf466]